MRFVGIDGEEVAPCMLRCNFFFAWFESWFELWAVAEYGMKLCVLDIANYWYTFYLAEHFFDAYRYQEN